MCANAQADMQHSIRAVHSAYAPPPWNICVHPSQALGCGSLPNTRLQGAVQDMVIAVEDVEDQRLECVS